MRWRKRWNSCRASSSKGPGNSRGRMCSGPFSQPAPAQACGGQNTRPCWFSYWESITVPIYIASRRTKNVLFRWRIQPLFSLLLFCQYLYFFRCEALYKRQKVDRLIEAGFFLRRRIHPSILSYPWFGKWLEHIKGSPHYIPFCNNSYDTVIFGD